MLVEIWSDVVCPWCAIGRARFAEAVAGFSHPEAVDVVYRDFELDPTAPESRPGTMAEHLSRKYGMSVAEAQHMNDHLVEVAALDGLEFDFDRARPGNTFDAHRLLQLALERGRQHEVLDALMIGYFRDGLAVAARDELADVAVGAGLDAAEVAEVLEGDRYADAVRADERRAQSLGISGVPFFLIEGKFAIPGAQSVERFAMALDRAWERISAD